MAKRSTVPDELPAEVVSHDLRYQGKGEDGDDFYRVTCPTCGLEMEISPSGFGRGECHCGYEWSVDVRAVGTRR
jgi:hypothetical protein